MRRVGFWSSVTRQRLGDDTPSTVCASPSRPRLNGSSCEDGHPRAGFAGLRRGVAALAADNAPGTNDTGPLGWSGPVNREVQERASPAAS